MSPDKGRQPVTSAKQQLGTGLREQQAPLAAVMIQEEVSPELCLQAKLKGSFRWSCFTDTQHSVVNSDQNGGREDPEHLGDLRFLQNAAVKRRKQVPFGLMVSTRI